MALLVCPECNEQVSEKAAMCQNCGLPIGNILVKPKRCPECAEIVAGADLACGCCGFPLKKQENAERMQPADLSPVANAPLPLKLESTPRTQTDWSAALDAAKPSMGRSAHSPSGVSKMWLWFAIVIAIILGGIAAFQFWPKQEPPTPLANETAITPPTDIAITPYAEVEPDAVPRPLDFSSLTPIEVVASGIKFASFAKLDVSESRFTNAAWPTKLNLDANYVPDGPYTIALGGDGVLFLTFSMPLELAGKTISLTPVADVDAIRWTCTSVNLAREFLPSQCDAPQSALLAVDPQASSLFKKFTQEDGLNSDEPAQFPQQPSSESDSSSHGLVQQPSLPTLDEQYKVLRKKCAGGFLGSSCRRQAREALCTGRWTDQPPQGEAVCSNDNR